MVNSAKHQEARKAVVSDDLEEQLKMPKEFTLIEEIVKKPQR